ncbi:MAG: hypothetical protein GYA24_26055 [Candidatus Lokiarchaeota archaeon]|nr:hypothetical protein [Candidatus Lokiarchaeota archaeon]
MLLVNCDIRVLRPAWHGQGIAFNQGLHVFVLDHPAWAYDRENGLHRVGPVSSGMLTSPPDAA